MNKNFGIKGMHCSNCAQTIEKGLKSEAGIKNANINFALSNLNLDFDESKTNITKIKNKIKSLGYQAEEENDFQKLEEEQKNYYKKRLIVSVIFAIPAFIIGMLLMWLGIDIPFRNFILFILATPIQFYIGYDFYKSAFNALKNKTANMDSLIALGTSAAYFFSVYSIFFAPQLGQYFETSAILITLVILGKN